MNFACAWFILGLAVALQLLHGDIEQLRREYMVLFTRGVSITRKLGFSDVIMPGTKSFFYTQWMFLMALNSWRCQRFICMRICFLSLTFWAFSFMADWFIITLCLFLSVYVYANWFPFTNSVSPGKSAWLYFIYQIVSTATVICPLVGMTTG